MPRRAVRRPDYVKGRRELANALGPRGAKARREGAREATGLKCRERGPRLREDAPQHCHLGAVNSPHLVEAARLSLKALRWPGQWWHGCTLAHLEASTRSESPVNHVTLGAREDRFQARQSRKIVEEAVPAIGGNCRDRMLGRPFKLAELFPDGARCAGKPWSHQAHCKPVGGAG